MRRAPLGLLALVLAVALAAAGFTTRARRVELGILSEYTAVC